MRKTQNPVETLRKERLYIYLITTQFTYIGLLFDF
jgi:hypothetical protein